MHSATKREKRIRRHARVRAKITGTPARPRLSVFRSNKHLHVQLIDDIAQKTLVSVSTVARKKNTSTAKGPEALATSLVEKATKAGIKEVVFDRGGHKFHGQVKMLADAARQAGLKF